MTGTLPRVGLFLLVCVFSTAAAQTAQDSPQQSISLTWIDGIFPEFCWLPPRENSKYEICTSTKESNETHIGTITSKQYCVSKETIMDGGRLQFFVIACSQRNNTLPVIDYNDKDLVKSWKCLIISSNLTHCSWEPASDDLTLSFFYILACGTYECRDKSPIQECPLYTHTGTRRTGCNLKMNSRASIRILLNGTMHKKTVRNTFKIGLLKVKPFPLIWTVNKTKNTFNISWMPPDVLIPTAWTYSINYTRCGSPPITEEGKRGTYFMLDREPSCQYHISIKAISDRGETEWSQEKTYDADTNFSWFAAIIIPLIVAVVAVLTLVCCRKNKENIFPKVPVPRDLLSDISENNNKITVGNLYSPAKEEEDCKITLVIDPQINKLDF